MKIFNSTYLWAALRIGIGWILFWAFADKTWGLGYSTPEESAWVNGGSPTSGFLEHGTSGPLADWFTAMAGNAAIDWLFMLGLLLIGVALLLGIGIRVAVFTGSLLFLMMWSANLPPQNNPLISEHIIYVIALLGILSTNDDQRLGFGTAWARTKLVRKYPLLR